MGGQNLHRREALRLLSLAAAASQFPGFHRWAFACGLHPSNSTPAGLPTEEYKPQFFAPEELTLLERLTELIIPNDGTPGAREAGVSEFIDFMVSSDPRIQYRFRFGLSWIDGHSRWLYGKPFLQLEEKQQVELLLPLAYRDRYRQQEEDGRVFFQLLREYTVMGFYTSRIGLEQLDYPGLRTMYETMPGCPHLNDPEHRHLPLPLV